MNSARPKNRERPRVVLPHSLRSNFLTTDGQGRPMICRDILKQAVFQSGVGSASSPLPVGGAAKYVRPVASVPRPPDRVLKMQRPQPTKARDLPKPTTPRTRILKPPPMEEAQPDRADSDDQSSRGSPSGLDQFDLSYGEPRSHQTDFWNDLNDFSDVGPVGDWNGDWNLSYVDNATDGAATGNESIVSGDLVSARNSDLSQSISSNNNNGVLTTIRAGRNNNNNSNNNKNNNNNNNNNGVVSAIGRMNTNNNNGVRVKSVRASKSSSSTNSLASANLGHVGTMKNPIFLTVVNDNLGTILNKRVGLKRSKAKSDEENDEVAPPSVEMKKRRVELNTAQCVMCPCCSFISLSFDEVMVHLKQSHPAKYRDMMAPDSDSDEDVECGDCGIKFPTVRNLKSHMSESHGTKRFVVQAIPIPSNSDPAEERSDTDDSDNDDSRDTVSTSNSDGVPFEDIPDASPDFDYQQMMEMNPASIAVTADSGLDLESDSRSETEAPEPEPGVPVACGFDGCQVLLDEVDMEYHRRCHGDGCFSCPECGHVLNQWTALAVHLWRCHSIDMNLKRCEYCDFRHATTQGMNAHLAVHAVNKNFACADCGVRFRTNQQRSKHVARVHRKKVVPTLPMQEDVFPCPECARTFAQHKLLKRHVQRCHVKYPALSCGVCDYRCGDSRAMAVHKRTHTGEKPFACGKCSLRFSDLNNLRRHAQNHAKEPVYSCPLCSYGCVLSKALKAHVAKAHPESVSEVLSVCRVCSKTCINRDALEKHMNQSHPKRNSFSGPMGSESASGAEANNGEVRPSASRSAVVGGLGAQSSILLENGVTLTVPAGPEVSSVGASSENENPMLGFPAGIPDSDHSAGLFDAYELFNGSADTHDLFEILDSDPVATTQSMLQFMS